MQAVDQRYGAEGATYARRRLGAELSQTMGMPTGTYEITCSADLARLIEAVAAERDREAFTALFDYFAPRIKAVLMRANTPPAAAEELAQDAMLTVWRKAAQFDRARGRVGVDLHHRAQLAHRRRPPRTARQGARSGVE